MSIRHLERLLARRHRSRRHVRLGGQCQRHGLKQPPCRRLRDTPPIGGAAHMPSSRPQMPDLTVICTPPARPHLLRVLGPDCLGLLSRTPADAEDDPLAGRPGYRTNGGYRLPDNQPMRDLTRSRGLEVAPSQALTPSSSLFG